MKFLFLLMAFSCCLICSSQNMEKAVNHPERYQLDLPADWYTPKIIKAVTYVLSETISELKDKDFCTQCTAGYKASLAFEYFTWDTLTGKNGYYHFKAMLKIFDSTGRYISQLVLISPEETFLCSKTESLVQNSQTDLPVASVIKENMNIYDETGTRIVGSIPVVSPHNADLLKMPGTNVYKTFVVEETELRMYSKQNLFKIQKMLMNLKDPGPF